MDSAAAVRSFVEIRFVLYTQMFSLANFDCVKFEKE
jgi:hypothetical protein